MHSLFMLEKTQTGHDRRKRRSKRHRALVRAVLGGNRASDAVPANCQTVEPAPWTHTLLGGVKIKLEAKNESSVRWGKEQSHSQCVHFVSNLYYHDDVDGVVDNNQDEDGGGTIVVTPHSICTAPAPCDHRKTDDAKQRNLVMLRNLPCSCCAPSDANLGIRGTISC